MSSQGFNVDEFADLEEELQPVASQILHSDIVELIKNIESDEETNGFKFTPYEIIWTPASSIGCLVLGIVLTPLLIGVFWLWIFFTQRPNVPILETSYFYECQYYMAEHHSILEYEILNGILDVTSCKVHPIAAGSYIGYERVSMGDNGNSRAKYTVRTPSNFVQLTMKESVKSPEVSRFSKFSGLEINTIS